METVTSPPTPAASAASAAATKKAPGSSVSVASEVVGICIFVGLIAIHPHGIHLQCNWFSQEKPFEVNFIKKKLPLDSQTNSPHILVPCP